MNWIPTIGPAAIGLLAAIPVGIILLYFLKLRREPVEVPSTYLWQAAIEDLHVNSLLQRLRRSLLLALQLAAIALAAIALFRPGIRSTDEKTDRRVFLLDTSASMRAIDTRKAGEGQSRFEVAKKRIRSEIDSMTDSHTAMLITFDDRSETLQAFTSDRNRLIAALDRVEVSSRETDILGALRAADGLANPKRSSEVGNNIDVQVADAKPADLMIYSDGGFDAVNDFSLGNLVPQYLPVGSELPQNLAITAMSAQRNVEKPGQVQVFATIANFGTTSASTTATLLGDQTFLDAETVELEPDAQTGISFELETEEATELELRLDAKDDLETDNRAYTALAPLRTVRVLIATPGNRPLELGLSTEKIAGICEAEIVDPAYLKTEAYLQRAKGTGDDLVIFDRCSPPIMPQANTFFIGSLPPASAEGKGTEGKETDAKQPETEPTSDSPKQSSEWTFSSKPAPLTIIDVDRSHPLLQYMELFSLLIVEGRAIEGPPGTTELVGADIGTVMAISPRGGFQDLVLGFELLTAGPDGSTQINTNWYAERSWPVFLLNLLRNLAGAAESSGATSYQPGQTVRVRLPSQLKNVVISRTGDSAKREFALGESGVIEFVDTEEAGNYKVMANDKLVHVFSVNLFSRRESQLAVSKEVEIGFEPVKGELIGTEVRREYWRWALIAMLGLLGLEWFLYGKRVA
jgi:Aerotolerance regulator N-terminal/von Willebrand factor type A domain